MGGKSSQETQQSQSTAPGLGQTGNITNLLSRVGGISSDLTGTENAALNMLASNAQAGNPYAPQISNVANTLLAGGGPDRTGMVNDAYQQYRTATDPTARGDFLDPNKNPFFASTAGGITDDVMERVRAEYAGAGRDPSGAGSYPGQVGGEVAKALAPMFGNAYSTERDRQMAAITGQYGAGGQTAGLLSGLDQTRLGNQQAGISAADAAITARDSPLVQQLQIESQRRGIPMQTLAAQLGMILPAAQAFGTTTGNSKTTKQMSPIEQFYMGTAGFKNLLPSGGGMPVPA